MPGPDIEAAIAQGVVIITNGVENELLRNALLAAYQATPPNQKQEALALARFCLESGLEPDSVAFDLRWDEQALLAFTQAVNLAHQAVGVRPINEFEMEGLMADLAHQTNIAVIRIQAELET